MLDTKTGLKGKTIMEVEFKPAFFFVSCRGRLVVVKGAMIVQDMLAS